MLERAERLKKNFSTLFWTKAFLNVKTYNIVAALFYIQRGLTLSEIFYLGIIWSCTSLISEVPSSYLADRWGRKKTILLGVAFSFVHWVIVLFANDFISFGIAFFFYSLSFAMISGTDEALLYDTHKELGGDESALGRLGTFMSAERMFKIFTVIFAAVVAKDLQPWQFVILICVDLFATIVSFGFTLRLVEPNHLSDVTSMQRGALHDALRLLRENSFLRKAMLGKTLFFIATFIPWRFQDLFFVQLGIPLIWFAIAWASYQALVFLSGFYIKKILPNYSLNKRINTVYGVAIGFLFAFLLVWHVHPYPYLLLFCYIGFEMAVSVANPWYGKLFHSQSASYNRATTISLTNALKGILEVPLLFLAAVAAGFGLIYPYYLAFGIVLVAFICFSLPKWEEST